jgi:hypothetical protein
MRKTTTFPELDRGGADHDDGASDDRLRKVVHAALAVYLLPAFVVVMTVGGLMLVATKAVQAGSLAAEALGLSRRRPSVAPWPKRVKAPVGGSGGGGGGGNVWSIRHAHASASKHGSNPSARS